MVFIRCLSLESQISNPGLEINNISFLSKDPITGNSSGGSGDPTPVSLALLAITQQLRSSLTGRTVPDEVFQTETHSHLHESSQITY